ncbi:MAG: HK97 family phage prohead protease [Burkholderiaceae bacterium]|nr:HK97 family phage prohead protease [Burkholderiaceae bacterium]
MEKFDFSGWATRNNLKCSDGRVILKDAFKHCDGRTVPLVWNHQHNESYNVLGHALLENREEGVYAYCTFNDTESGQNAKLLVEHGDITALSIYANQLKQKGSDVLHGAIREVSLVLAGANPGAFIESVICHDDSSDEEAVIYTGENISLYHAEKETTTEEKEEEKVSEETKKADTAEKAESTEKEETVADLFKEAIDSLDEKHQDAVYAVIGEVMDSSDEEETEEAETAKHSDEGDDVMKHNVFDQETVKENTLTHADQEAILSMAKQSNVGSLKMAMQAFAAENEELAHGFETEALTALLPDFKNLNPGAPEILREDQSWVMKVINKIHKSPYSRIRTRQADARISELKAKGYQKKGDQKKLTDTIKLIGRTFDPQTIYIKDEIHRDDIIDITDFDYVAYVWNLMKDNMYETLALAALVGDSREDTDPDKIHENHVCPIYNDDELYTIHRTVNFEAAKSELQGTNTGANFSENYIYAEAIIMEALYAREKFKGSGKPDLYCTPHLVNIMLLARDLNGRRIYDSKADLAKALNVGEIFEIEQLEGKTRTDKEGNTKKLLALFVNLNDYQFGSTKGGEITKFEDFDIDFNKHKYLMETRLSGALTKLYSAIALEETVSEEVAG